MSCFVVLLFECYYAFMVKFGQSVAWRLVDATHVYSASGKLQPGLCHNAHWPHIRWSCGPLSCWHAPLALAWSRFVTGVTSVTGFDIYIEF